MTDSYDVLSPEESVSLRGMIELGDFKIDADERTATLRADHMTPRAVHEIPLLLQAIADAHSHLTTQKMRPAPL
jgi:hypothetical protein